MTRYTLPALLFIAFVVAYPRAALIVLCFLLLSFTITFVCVLVWIARVMRDDPANKGEASEP